MQRARGYKKMNSFSSQYLQTCLATTALLTLLISFTTEAQSDNERYNFPGGIAQLLLEKHSDYLPEVKFGTSEPVIIDEKKHWRIIIGLGLDTLPGEYLVYVKRTKEDSPAKHEKFRVRQKTYPLAESNTTPNARTYQKDSNFSDIEYNNTQQPNLPLQFPAQGQWNESFGQNNYNNKKQELLTQNGVFIKVDTKISVTSPENAIISKITTDTNGISRVYLDHGRGLYSIIDGITDLSVETGNGVVRGAVIGIASEASSSEKKTTRSYSKQATRYLTWQCIINNVYVNPIILTQLSTKT